GGAVSAPAIGTCHAPVRCESDRAHAPSDRYNFFDRMSEFTQPSHQDRIEILFQLGCLPFGENAWRFYRFLKAHAVVHEIDDCLRDHRGDLEAAGKAERVDGRSVALADGRVDVAGDPL